MNVNALMTAPPITTGPDTLVVEARQLMSNRRIRHLLVTDGPKLLGIITETDLLRAFVKAS
jgi:CBS domain-containing protein